MFVICSVDLEKNYQVKIHDTCELESEVEELLDTVAVNFISREQGERFAQNPYRDNIDDSAITEDGYFLRHSTVHRSLIDVYQRKTRIINGWWNSYEITCKKIKQFSVSEASMGQPSECTKRKTTKPLNKTFKENSQRYDYIKDLEQHLVAIKARVDKQINISE